MIILIYFDKVESQNSREHIDHTLNQHSQVYKSMVPDTTYLNGLDDDTDTCS